MFGFDDTYAAAWKSPPLTTAHQPLQEMGRAAVRTLRDMAAGTTPDIHRRARHAPCGAPDDLSNSADRCSRRITMTTSDLHANIRPG